MSYNKKIREENRIVYQAAIVALTLVGWNPKEEKHKKNMQLSNDTYARRKEAVDRLQKEFPDIPRKRILNQVNKLMGRWRGEK